MKPQRWSLRYLYIFGGVTKSRDGAWRVPFAYQIFSGVTRSRDAAERVLLAYQLALHQQLDVRLPSPRDPRCNCCGRLPSPCAFLLAAWWESAKTDRQSKLAKGLIRNFKCTFRGQIRGCTLRDPTPPPSQGDCDPQSKYKKIRK